MRRAGWRSLTWLLGILVLLDVLVVLGVIADMANHVVDLAGGLGTIAVLLVVGVGLVAAGRSVRRHRGRRDPPKRGAAGERPFHSRPDRRIETAVTLVAFVGLAIVTPIWVEQAWTKWRASVTTQDHGVASTLTIRRVTRVVHHIDHGLYHTVHLQGELDPPVGGRTETTAYVPDSTEYSPQEQIRVLVNPHNLGYAERPGLEDYSPAGLVGSLFLAIVIYASLVLLVVLGIRQRFRTARR